MILYLGAEIRPPGRVSVQVCQLGLPATQSRSVSPIRRVSLRHGQIEKEKAISRRRRRRLNIIQVKKAPWRGEGHEITAGIPLWQNVRFLVSE